MLYNMLYINLLYTTVYSLIYNMFCTGRTIGPTGRRRCEFIQCKRTPHSEECQKIFQNFSRKSLLGNKQTRSPSCHALGQQQDACLGMGQVAGQPVSCCFVITYGTVIGTRDQGLCRSFLRYVCQQARRKTSDRQ